MKTMFRFPNANISLGDIKMQYELGFEQEELQKCWLSNGQIPKLFCQQAQLCSLEVDRLMCF